MKKQLFKKTMITSLLLMLFLSNLTAFALSNTAVDAFKWNTVANLPTVTTTAATAITLSGATLAGNVTSDGGATVTERGIVYSVTATNSTPLLQLGVPKIVIGSGTGIFSNALSGLIGGTQYSYRAYAINSVGVSYGAIQTFTTLSIPATHLNFDGANDYVNLGTTLNTVLDPINTFTVEAWVRPENTTGFAAIIGNYDLYNNSMQFSLYKNGNDFSFSVDVGSGSQNVTSVGSVALNTFTHVAGVWDGSTLKMYINGVLSTTTTGVTGASFVSRNNSILIGGYFGGGKFDGDIEEVRMWTKALSASEISARKDIELFGNEDGLLAYYKMNQGTNNANNTAISTLTDNSTNTYNGTLNGFALTGTASNWASGSSISTSGIVPTVTTTAAASITPTGATLAGNASTDGGAGITEKGIVLSVTANNSDPLIGGASVVKIVKGTGTGVFSDAVSGLIGSTGYSYKAYATNALGTSYGAVQTFTTLAPVAPSVSTTAAATITGESAILAGNATSNGGAAITERGIVYSVTATNNNPVIGGGSVTKDTNGSGTGVFSEAISGLSETTQYSYKAYAINGIGTTYGAVMTFTTLTAAAPTVTTTAATHITPTTTRVAGKVTSDGNLSITERGIVYSVTATNATPAIGGAGVTKNTNGTGLGMFTKLAIGLTGNTTYTYRAYAINSLGTSYGSLQTFTTLPAGTHTPVFVAQPDNPFGLVYIGDDITPRFIDIDNDGDLDCIAGNYSGDFKYLENTGTSTAPIFSTVSTNPSGLTNIGYYNRPTFIDIDSDGDLDCIAGDEDGDFKYFENTGTAALPAFATVSTNPFGLTIIATENTPSFIDIDNDGDLDCIAGDDSGNFKYFENTGTAAAPAFATVSTNPFGLTQIGALSGLSYSKPWFIDIDNDGDLDCIAGDEDGDFEYFENTGTAAAPAFAAAVINPFGLANIGFYNNPTFIDIDNDGDVDCIAGNENGDFKFFKQSKVWSGSTDTNWTTATNWSLGVLPTTTDDVVITDVANDPIINSGTHVTVNNATINTSGVLTINGGGDLTVNGNNTNNGTFTLESASSLIVNGTSSGNITYKRNLGTANWYLVSNPFNGQSINTFTVTDVANAIATNGVNYAVAPYDNNSATWNYYTTSAGSNDVASVGNFVTGKGYSTKRTATGDLNFTGTMPTTNVNISITDGTANEFNLIGNPYPSYLPANTNADAVNNVLTINTAQLQEETLWFWDQSTSSYTQINQASASRFIPPAQGFFVNAKISGGTFSFTEAMQSHQATDVFSRTTNNRFEINLAITDGTTTKNTEIYYINGTTTAFDNGYDSSIFSGTSNAFAVYTQTVADSQGRKLGIQSLPDNNYENMIIPVGINATSGTEITFSVDAQNIPAGIDIYLENRTDNTFTKLNDNGSYTITLSADTNGVGQFYLRTSSSALGLEDVTLTGVSMYTTDNTTLKIIGLQNGKSTVKIFTLLGKKVLQQAFESTGNNDISLPKLAAGVYIVNVQNTHGTLTKKIILQ